MADNQATIERDRQLILGAKGKGRLATLVAYVRLAGPGWLQSAITLGGGSLASSLYLGVLAGLSLLWLQPLAMILGVIMLSAIGYVTLSTGEKPFQAINKHVNPVLGWGWAIATLMANLVWALPQFSLATASVRENLLPGVFGIPALSGVGGKVLIGVTILVVCTVVVWFYDTGSKGIKFFEILLKVMVGIIILCFFGVVIALSLKTRPDGTPILDWGRVGWGLIPDLKLLVAPAGTFSDALGQVAPQFRVFWSDMIVSQQRDVMISAAATAVGINMTFLLPYSMLKRGWNRDFRGLAVFDLSTGLFVPFILATACVVIASASQFHTQPAEGFFGEKDEKGQLIKPAPKAVGMYKKNATARISYEIGKQIEAELGKDALDVLRGKETDGFIGALVKLPSDKVAGRIEEFRAARDQLKSLRGKPREALVRKLTATGGEDHTEAKIAALPEADRKMAATLVKRDAFDLAQSLSPLTGDIIAHYVFGIGVVGMAVSSIIILMLINGFVVCEVLGRPSQGWLYRLGCLAPGISGFCAVFLWTGGKAQFWLAVPTSVFGFMLIPIAYITFALVMNQKSLLKEHMPTGGKRVAWNVLMIIAAGVVALGSFWNIWNKAKQNLGSGWYGIAGIAAFVALALIVHFIRKARARPGPA